MKKLLVALHLCLNFFAPSVALAYEVPHYKGLITPERIALFIKSFPKNAAVVRITSEGGDVLAAIRLADFIHANGISITVDKYCLSSCANYVFLAANTKEVLPNSVLGFHGVVHAIVNQTERDQISRGQSFNEVFGSSPIKDLMHIAYAEFMFFQRVGISECIFTSVSEALSSHNSAKEHESLKKIDGNLEYKFEGKSISASGANFAQELDILLQRIKMDPTIVFTVSFFPTPSAKNVVVFPAVQRLRSCGISGIKAYEFPSTSSALTKILSNIGFGDLVVILGDDK